MAEMQGTDAKSAAMLLNSAVKVTPEVLSDVIDFVQQGHPEKVNITRDRHGTFIEYDSNNFITRSITPDEVETAKILSNFDNKRPDNKAGKILTVNFEQLGKEIAKETFAMNYDGYKAFRNACVTEKTVDEKGEAHEGISHLAFEAKNEKGKPRIYVVVAQKDFAQSLRIAKEVNHGRFLSLSMDTKELKALAKTRDIKDFVQSYPLSEQVYFELRRSGALYNVHHSVERKELSKGNVYTIKAFADDRAALERGIIAAEISAGGRAGELKTELMEKRAKEREEILKNMLDSKKDIVIVDRMNPDHGIQKVKDEIHMVWIKENGEIEKREEGRVIKISSHEWQQRVYKELERYKLPVALSPLIVKKEVSKMYREKGTVKRPFEERAVNMKISVSTFIADKMEVDPHYKDNLIRLANARDFAIINKDDSLARDLDDDISLISRSENRRTVPDLSDIRDSYENLSREAAEAEKEAADKDIRRILYGTEEKDQLPKDKKEERLIRSFIEESPRMHRFIISDIQESINECEGKLEPLHELSIDDLDKDYTRLLDIAHEREDLEYDMDEQER